MTSTAASGSMSKPPSTPTRDAASRWRVSRARMPFSPAARPSARKIVTDGSAELFGTEFMTGQITHAPALMLNSIVSWALNMRVLVVAAALALLLRRHQCHEERAAGCLPRIRAAAGRGADGSARAFHGGGGCARHRAVGEFAQRPALSQDDPLEVRARPVVRGDDLRHRHRHSQGAAAGAGAAESRAKPPACRGEAAGAHGAVFVAEPRVESGPHLEDASTDGAERTGAAGPCVRVSCPCPAWPMSRSGASAIKQFQVLVDPQNGCAPQVSRWMR